MEDAIQVVQCETSRSGTYPTARPKPRLDELEALCEAYHRQALWLAYRLLGDRAAAEDVVQEALLHAWRGGDGYEPARGSRRTWFLSLVRHGAIDALRSRSRRPTLPMEERADWADTCDTADQASTHVDGEAARLAFARLPPAQRQVLELAYFDGLTHTEIARQLAIPTGTVKGRIRLGLDRLRSELRLPDLQTLSA